jgi:hypothetical protein
VEQPLRRSVLADVRADQLACEQDADNDAADTAQKNAGQENEHFHRSPARSFRRAGETPRIVTSVIKRFGQR